MQIKRKNQGKMKTDIVETSNGRLEGILESRFAD